MSLNQLHMGARLGARLGARSPILGLCILLLGCSNSRPATKTHQGELSSLADVRGLWKYPDRQVWVQIGLDSTAFQCRIGDDTVYRSQGRVDRQLIIHWNLLWSEDTLHRHGDTLLLAGVYGTFGYLPTREAMAPLCAG